MITISASQIDTYEDCNRHWWLRRVLKLKEPPAAHFTFGTVLHSVIERWLSATDNGRVPGLDGATIAEGPFQGQLGGQPVNLYPKRWTVAVEMDGSTAEVTPTEARQIQALVAEAIENGIIYRTPSMQLERSIRIAITENVQLVGYIDLFRGRTTHDIPEIGDHKSYGKGSVRYLKREDPDSPNYLGKNQQLRTYAWASSEIDDWDGPVKLRHNQYPKFEGPGVSKVEAVLSADEIADHGDYLREIAQRIERTSKVKEWSDVPGPTDTGKCAHWYGQACPFAQICGRTESPEVYQARVARLLEQRTGSRLDLPLPTPRKRGTAKEASSVSIFDRAKQQQAQQAARQEAAGTADAVAAVEQAKPAAQAPAINGGTPPAAPPPAIGGAPWANPSCRACKGRGLSSSGKACPICDATAKKAGKPTSMAYIIELDDAGKGVAVAREEQAEALQKAGMPLEWIEADSPAQPTVPAPVAAPVVATVQEPVPTKATVTLQAAPVVMSPERQAVVETLVKQAPEPVQEAPKAAKAAAEKSKGGRPTVGVTLMIGAVQLRGVSRPTVTSAEVLARFGAELAADMGAESYWALDTFKRRERLAQKADYIAGELARHVVVHPGILGNDDVGSLLQALMGLKEGVEAVITRVG